MAEPGESLSDREQVVLEGLVAGSTNREIADDLSISPNTVKVHVRNIFTKLAVSSRTEAATLAIQKGLVSVSSPELEEEAALLTEDPRATMDRINDAAVVKESPLALPGRLPTWSWIAFVLILLAGLVVGVLASNWLRTRDASPIPNDEASDTDVISEQIAETRWFTSQPLARARTNMALASVGLDLFLIGGEVDAGVINLVNILETDTGIWQTGSSKPTAVTEASAAVLFGEIVVPGGLLADGRPTAVVEGYSPANNAWRPMAALPRPVAGGLILSDGNTLYFMGGWDGERSLNDSYIYDPVEDSWSPLPPMQYARANATGAFVADRLYVVGGRDGELSLDVCEYFDPIEQTWTSCPAMTKSRSNAGAGSLANRFLYVMGGGPHGQQANGEFLDTLSNSWQPVEIPMFDEPRTWSGLGVAAVESRLFVMGGMLDEQLSSGNYIFAPLTNRTYLPAIGSQ